MLAYQPNFQNEEKTSERACKTKKTNVMVSLLRFINVEGTWMCDCYSPPGSCFVVEEYKTKRISFPPLSLSSSLMKRLRCPSALLLLLLLEADEQPIHRVAVLIRLHPCGPPESHEQLQFQNIELAVAHATNGRVVRVAVVNIIANFCAKHYRCNRQAVNISERERNASRLHVAVN